MKLILEYEEFIDEKELKRKILILAKSPAGLLMNKKNTEFMGLNPSDIDSLISLGAVSAFSGLIPLSEDDDDKIMRILKSSQTILREYFTNEYISYKLYDFFTEISPERYEFFKGNSLIRNINWESVK